MKTETEPGIEYINPSEWQIRGQLRHSDGLIYSRGEPLPVITVEEARRYEAQGSLVRVQPDGTISEPLHRAPAPPTAAAYLYNKDEMVLRAIVDHRPSKKLLQEILGLAKMGGRSMTLRFAIEIALIYAGVKHPHADSPRE